MSGTEEEIYFLYKKGYPEEEVFLDSFSQLTEALEELDKKPIGTVLVNFNTKTGQEQIIKRKKKI